MMKNNLRFYLVCFLSGLLLAAVSKDCYPQAGKPGKDRDYLGYYLESKQYHKIKNSGITVVDLPEEEGFFVVWVPPSGSAEKTMVLLHGTGGTAYDELADEMGFAEKYGYALISLQWLNKKTGVYAPALKVNRMIDKAFRYLQKERGLAVRSAALCGFSRGGAVSYEVAYRDRMSARHLDLIIAHSGGIPKDHIVAPGEKTGPDKFFSDLASGALGTEAFKDLSFFLYAGCQDEEWGTRMCEYMRYTKEVIEKNGGKVAGCVIDPKGRHGGYRQNEDYHRQAVEYFMKDPR